MSHRRKTADCRACGKRTYYHVLLPESDTFVPLCWDCFGEQWSDLAMVALEQLRARLRLHGHGEMEFHLALDTQYRDDGPFRIERYRARVQEVDVGTVYYALTLHDMRLGGQPPDVRRVATETDLSPDQLEHFVETARRLGLPLPRPYALENWFAVDDVALGEAGEAGLRDEP